MKTSELTGALLDLWVAKADGKPAYIRRERITMNNEDGSLNRVLVDEDRCFRKRWDEEDKPAAECKGSFWLSYSSDWMLGGPIIHRERIDLTGPDDGATDWWAYCWDDRLQENWMGKGETPLIAAMRAFCGAKFGHEVPDDHEAKIDSAKP